MQEREPAANVNLEVRYGQAHAATANGLELRTDWNRDVVALITTLLPGEGRASVQGSTHVNRHPIDPCSCCAG